MSDRVKIEVELLKKVSDYYEFPFAVFFKPLDSFNNIKAKNRRESLMYKVEAYNKIKNIILNQEKGGGE